MIDRKIYHTIDSESASQPTNIVVNVMTAHPIRKMYLVLFVLHERSLKLNFRENIGRLLTIRMSKMMETIIITGIHHCLPVK